MIEVEIADEVMEAVRSSLEGVPPVIRRVVEQTYGLPHGDEWDDSTCVVFVLGIGCTYLDQHPVPPGLSQN